MTGRIREVLFDDGVDASGTAIEAASKAYVDAKFDPVEPSELGIWLENTSGLPTLSPWRAGVIAWDTQNKCMAVSTSYNGSWIQVGQEMTDDAVNKTGSPLANGTVVYYDSSQGNRPKMYKAYCTDEIIANKTIGLVTQDAGIADNAEGPVTTSGVVRGLNTNSFVEGDLLWLDTVAGQYTKTQPSLQYEQICIGIVIKAHLTQGEIYVSIKNITNQIAKMGFHTVDPHGWTEYDNTYMTRGWVGNTFTLTQVGTSTPYYHKGKLKYLTGNKSIAITPTAGIHFIGLNCTTEVLEDLGSDFPISQVISTHLLVEYSYANGTDVIYNANERHSTKFLKRDWIYKHLSFSTQYRSGITPTMTSIDGNGSSLDHARFSCTAGIIADEDIEITISALTSLITKTLWYYNGTIWVRVSEVNGSGVAVSGSGRASYNNVATGLVECTNNYHVLTHLFAANDGTIIGIIGNAEYLTVSSARTAASTEIGTLLTTGLPFPEFRAIATFINQTSNTYSNAVKSKIVSVDTGIPYIDWRKTALNPAAGANAANHNQLSSLQGGQAGEYYHLTAAQNMNIVNNVFPAGTSTNTANKILLPTNTTAGWAALTPTESMIGWDSTKKKPVIGNGISVLPIGGGLVVTVLDAPATSGVNLEAGKHYVVINLSADTVLNLPQLAGESAIEISVVNMTPNETYRVTLACYAGDEISYDGIQTHTAAKLVYANTWAKFSANLTTFWQVNDASSPLNGTFSGPCTFTGPIVGNISPSAYAGADSAVTLVSTDRRFQYVTLGADRIYKLPTTGIVAGDTFTFVNKSAYKLSIQSSGANAVDDITSGKITVMALVDTPTTAANWMTVDALSGWVNVSLSIANTTVTLVESKARRDGDTLELYARYGGATSDNTIGLILTVPYNLSIGSSALYIPLGSFGSDQAIGSNGNGLSYWAYRATSTTIQFFGVQNVGISGYGLNNNTIYFRLKFPIAEWAMFS